MHHPRTLADYALHLRDEDDEVWRLRVVLHEFGLCGGSPRTPQTGLLW